jgi:UTP--glucose-1-phosphate uridylyltransferase
MTTLSTPGALEKYLTGELDALPEELRERLRRAGFDVARFVSLAATLAHGTPAERRKVRNRVAGPVRPPDDCELLAVPGPDSREYATGLEAIRKGSLALCVMAGGMATRMGGVVKALVEALPGRTFLSLRLAENAAWSKRAGRDNPLWLMTSDATDGPIRGALEAAHAPARVRTFTQDLGLRLTPEAKLFREDTGEPSTYATGHGDLVDAVRRSGLLRAFRASGGEYVWIANLDNLGATVDPAILGLFIESGRDVMVEVCDKAEGDKGGIPVWSEGKLQVLEEFRLPEGFDPASVRVFNTNTFLVRAEALETAAIRWNWFEVEKEVGGRRAIQFERLLQELTAALGAAYVRVPREGPSSRFLPVKDMGELAKRKPEIEAVARARGMS